MNETLNMLSQTDDMDYCEIFDEIKSHMEHCHINVKPFHRLAFRPGNEMVLNDLVGRLQDLFVKHNLISICDDGQVVARHSSHSDELRKVTLFLFAQTDSSYKYNLREDCNLAHIFELCPLMPKFLLLELIWELDLDQYFCEVLSYTPCWFSFQYFEPASASFKYMDDPYKVLERVEALLIALFTTMSRSILREIDEVDKKIIYGKLYDATMSLLRQFNTPDAFDVISRMGRREKMRYVGQALLHLLQALVFACEIYYNPLIVLTPHMNISIYQICQQKCPVLPVTEIGRHHSVLLKESQMRIITALLNTLQNMLLTIDTNTYMEWEEVELGLMESMQDKICNLIFEVRGHMLRRPDDYPKHNVMEQLNCFARPPRSVEESAKKATIGDILRELSHPRKFNNLCRGLWFDQLLLKPSALGNDEILDFITENIGLVKPKHLSSMFEYIKQDMLTRSQDMSMADVAALRCYEDHMVIIQKAANRFSVDEIREVLLHQRKYLGAQIDMLRLPRYRARVNTYFNKTLGSDSDYKDFLVLCLEDIADVWEQLFHFGLKNRDNLNIFVNFTKLSKDLSEPYITSAIQEALYNVELHNSKLLPGLICDVFYPERLSEMMDLIWHNHNIDDLLTTNKLPLVTFIVKTLTKVCREAKTGLPFGSHTKDLLMGLAKIMDACRWDLANFSFERHEIVCECILFLEYNLDNYVQIADPPDLEDIQSIIEKCRPLTKFYFQGLTPAQGIKELDDFLIPNVFDSQKQADLAQNALLAWYIRCTTGESERLVRRRFLPHIEGTMVILGKVVRDMNNTRGYPAYRFCMANFASIVRTNFRLQMISKNDRITKFITSLLGIVESTPDELYEDSFNVMTSVLMEMKTWLTIPMDLDKHENVRRNLKAFEKRLKGMKDCSAHKICIEQFSPLFIAEEVGNVDVEKELKQEEEKEKDESEGRNIVDESPTED